MSKIALVESEYTKLKQGVTDVHDECLQQIETVTSEIEKLNSKGGGFQAEELTPMIDDILEVLATVKSQMIATFDAHEEIITSFGQVVDDYDSLD